jgi:hypothetical protein
MRCQEYCTPKEKMNTEKSTENLVRQALALTVKEMHAVFRRSEKHWLSQAMDYEIKYGGTGSYDRDFKRDYLDNATACLRAAKALQNIPLLVPGSRFAQVMDTVTGMKEAPVAPTELRDFQMRMDSLSNLKKQLDNCSVTSPLKE